VKSLVTEQREPKPLAYLIGGCLAMLLATIANLVLGWSVAWYVVLLSVVLGLFGVFMLETVCEAIALLAIASIPLAFVLWYHPDYSIGKQIWLSALVSYGAGKLWVGLLR
jgi:uncharacterized RDD family membrane protein YckC